VLGSPDVIFQTDVARDAVRYCMGSNKPCNVIETSNDEVIYRNCYHPTPSNRRPSYGQEA
jgi:hypothetical protein